MGMLDAISVFIKAKTQNILWSCENKRVLQQY